MTKGRSIGFRLKRLFVKLKRIVRARAETPSQKKAVNMLAYFVGGMLIASSLNTFGMPSYPDVLIFGLVVLGSLFIVISSGLNKEVGAHVFRPFFLGASVISVFFAFRTFLSISDSNGVIQIPIGTLAGLFRSVLLASFFSLLERLARFFEDWQTSK